MQYLLVSHHVAVGVISVYSNILCHTLSAISVAIYFEAFLSPERVLSRESEQMLRPVGPQSLTIHKYEALSRTLDHYLCQPKAVEHQKIAHQGCRYNHSGKCLLGLQKLEKYANTY